MVGHRAAYRLVLDRARDNSDIAQASGAMLFEVLDACDGWTVRQRLTLKLTDRDGNETETVSDYSTYETRDGTRLRFALTQSSQGAVSSQVQGEAEVTATGGTVRFAQPNAREIALPAGTLLPMAHTIATLNAARAGTRILAVPLLDGTTASGPQDTTTVMSAWQAAAMTDPRFPALIPLGSSRMRIAFFDRDQTSQSGGAGTPDYEVSLRYYENGVADELKMDFGEFVVDGRMVELAVLPSPC
ncbi:cell envelope integrity EipB family protein [Roseomonas arctica]|uniref:Cell envelope integrity EipB family protein n=2 Tax=Plastoroseomonas arctica TaxID=1509237 RepID=A0AAF1K559_9PROT|nr:cell envelope integrity EipB family protein [Plastoroseomonas arctica]